jgi:hypothetical protein
MAEETRLLCRDRIKATLDEILIARAMAGTVKAIMTAVETEDYDYWVSVDLNVHIRGGKALEKHARINVYGDLTKDVVRDVQGGMEDTLLMEKYDLNPKQLETMLRKLLEAGLITHMQLYERTSVSDSLITRAFVEAGTAIKELD